MESRSYHFPLRLHILFPATFWPERVAVTRKESISIRYTQVVCCMSLVLALVWVECPLMNDRNLFVLPLQL